MRITNVRIQNFRLLDDCNVRLDDLTTVLVGKNNAGKTSFSCIIQLFMNNKKFMFDDFSINCHPKFVNTYKEYVKVKDDNEKLEDFFNEIDQKVPSIEMQLDIEYGIDDNWSNIRPLLTTLDSLNNLQILFSYEIKEPKAYLEKLHVEMRKIKIKKKEEKAKIIELV
ncbi:hypothetical protein M670_03563 [Schinkia azotoformans MEV2011]|uniref:Endonuclease GajA/Old nuclease/RecF-like AAA domain-containing protein n=1 Tax=Schinkia azotoformans MEV2011 TaxID=1348973 RepID=A0A072NHJ1_SCHAZ|nr:AAA family ATPase [Schinkia azotoformans]KEF37144.1 hypothetical protein M670_03563 [Schinkia azotoformans MEV2011]MEC1695427.1 AAA family ATPase [Schinkia azotoformans]MEC1725707.1 AAA family ATPase [Schinkia azotoformans]MEC1741766.1 AAA family ATPase [Schinkia azotoformans]MEC1767010.1 AAA family ATPase [Schinkia azotoformans]